jgi:hypothetical protein
MDCVKLPGQPKEIATEIAMKIPQIIVTPISSLI